MTWPELTDHQLRIRLATAMGLWYWPNRDRVEDLIAFRNRDPEWTIIDEVLAA